ISCQIRVTPIPPEAENETVDNSIQSDYNTRMENEWMNDVQAGSYRDTYYIHSFDGKLLSEYDGSGNCLRDYVYMGNRLIGDYQPGSGTYHYYMSDQVSSTRVISDGSGNIVYSEAYGPYGDIQKSFKTDYIPRLTYSGKEREADSGLDYFGARYFQNRLYRFISVDPFVDKDKALVNPQSWNLYAYCRNNPITYFDPDGKLETPHSASRYRQERYQRYLMEGGHEYAFQKIMSDMNCEFVGGLAGAAFLTGYLYGPEIISALISATSLTPLASKGTEKADRFKFAVDPLEHLKNPDRSVPIQILEQAMKTKGFPDPQGSKALMYYARIYRNGKLYNLEVLYEKSKNMIYHFEYTDKAAGPFPPTK
ncbi:MAG: RHS repeat domain-containing protein, partial [Candidatus Omnitrophota bacterium]